jgi:hypothetical protein
MFPVVLLPNKENRSSNKIKNKEEEKTIKKQELNKEGQQVTVMVNTNLKWHPKQDVDLTLERPLQCMP